MALRSARRLKGLRCNRVDLVDAGASFDESTGTGSHIVLFKSRDGMPEGWKHGANDKLDFTKGIPMECAACGDTLPTRYSEGGMQLASYCPECGAKQELTASGGANADEGADDTSDEPTPPAKPKPGAPKPGAKQPPPKPGAKKSAAPFPPNGTGGTVAKNTEGAMTLKIEDSWPQEAKDAITALQASVTELTAKLTPPEDKDAVAKAELSPAARALVEKAEASAKAANDRAEKTATEVAKLMEARAVESFEKIASVYKHLPGWDRVKGGKILKAIADKCDEATSKELTEVLKAADAAIEASPMFETHGRDGALRQDGQPGSAAEAIEREAAELVSKGTHKTINEARDAVIAAKPELYRKHRSEQLRRTHRDEGDEA